MANALEMEGVGKRFGAVVAVEEVTLTVAEGEVVGLVARNGAGKTTAIHLATGLLRPSAGCILERGRLLGFGSPDELRARFGREGPLESLLVEVLGGAQRGELSWL